MSVIEYTQTNKKLGGRNPAHWIMPSKSQKMFIIMGKLNAKVRKEHDAKIVVKVRKMNPMVHSKRQQISKTYKILMDNEKLVGDIKNYFFLHNYQRKVNKHSFTL